MDILHAELYFTIVVDFIFCNQTRTVNRLLRIQIVSCTQIMSMFFQSTLTTFLGYVMNLKIKTKH